MIFFLNIEVDTPCIKTKQKMIIIIIVYTIRAKMIMTARTSTK